MTDCRKALRLMYEKIDRILDRKGEEQLQAHLERCDRCAREYEKVLALHSLYSRQTLAQPTTGLAARVLSEIIAEAPTVARARFRQFYWDKIATVAQSGIALVVLYLLVPYLLSFKPLSSGLRFFGQIFDIDLRFFSSLSLPDIYSLILGLAARVTQSITGFSESVAGNLQPNLLAVIAGLLVLQLVINKLLFASLRS